MPLGSFTFPNQSRLLVISLLLISWSLFPNRSTEISSAQAANSTWFVNHAAGDVEDGTSWATAFKNLQAALESAQASDQIWVAQGVYYPTRDPNDRAASFVLKNGVALYGGFVGNETALEGRNWEVNRTILSGDIDQNDLLVSGVITSTSGIVGNNSYHVLRGKDIDPSTIIDGFVITAASAKDDRANKDGGGIYNDNSNPTISNVSFFGNAAEDGGAIYNNESSPTISNVSFSGNTAVFGGAIYNMYSHQTISNVSFSGNTAEYGGAIYNVHSQPSINNATFSGNAANNNGGAIHTIFSSLSISNATFSSNTTNTEGGAIYLMFSDSSINDISLTSNSADEGGAIYNGSSTLNISTATFSNNSADEGGAIFNMLSSPTISNATFAGNTASSGGAIFNNINSSPTISNVLFTGNAASNDGGAIYNNSNSPTISNATFTGNAANNNGGAIYNRLNSSNISNATFAGNVASLGGAIFNFNNSSPTINNASFSGNIASNDGGAIVNDNHSSPTITNASFSANSAVNSGGAIRNNNNSSSVLSNSIIWGNSSTIALIDSSSITITHSLVEGCNPVGGWAADCGNDNGGNLSPIDPLFVKPISHTSAPTTTGDVHLQAGSPAINKGHNALNPTTSDLDGKPRIIGSHIDLGAYEAGYQFTKNLVGSGEISHTPSSEWQVPNTTITITATAKPGWSFAGWSGDLNGNSSPTTLLINDTKQITATFTNDPPTADAGADQSALVGTLVTLDGSASFDADPSQTLSYAWTQTAGAPVTLAGANSAQPTFSAPSVAATLTFTLVVTDSLGIASAADSVTITVTNGEPVANAGADQTVLVGSTVTLDGSASSDPDGHTPLAYAWTQTAGTPVSLSDSSAVSPSFTAPNAASVLTFSLVVTDSIGLASAADSVTITVEKPIYTVYLPQVLGQEQRPNLVITELSADQNGIRVVISNTGDAANQAGFWVDLYVNPRQTPTANTVWQKIAPAGAAWAVKETIEPGQSLILTQSSPFYVPDYSYGRFAVGDQLYAYVDSYHSSNSYGAELESDESDNRFGPIKATHAGNLSLPSTQEGDTSSLPAR